MRWQDQLQKGTMVSKRRPADLVLVESHPAARGGRTIPDTAADAAGTARQKVDEDHRLPRTVCPVRYELSISIDPGAPRFTGSERVELVISDRVGEIVCHCAELSITGASLRSDQHGTSAPAAEAVTGAPVACRVGLDPARERVTFTPPAPLSPGRYVLEVDYSGVLGDKLRGPYRSRFVDDSGVERFIATTQFQSTDARRAFPCWDEPDFKAAFAISLDVPDGLVAVSNGPEIASTPLPGGYRRVRFGQTPPMSSYIVAFVVGPLEASEVVDVDGVPLRVLHTPGKGHLAHFALKVGAYALRFFREWFDLPYPAAKLDLVAIPDRLGAMENLGAAIFVDSTLLADETGASAAELARIAGVISHEIAHMWFGDLVTMKWWNGIWLNEAFASFMHLTCVSHFEPSWESWADYARQRDDALVIDALHSTRPIEFPVRTPDEAEAMFDVLTYQKGASVLRMIEQHVGPERFREGVRRYLRAHKFANAETSDLWAAIGEVVSDASILPLMDSWVFQGGVPLVEVNRQEDAIVLTQRRFLMLDDGPRHTDSPDGQGGGASASWLIPICVEYRNGGKSAEPAPARLVLGPEPIRLAAHAAGSGASLLVANAGGHGYYRTRYDPESLGKLLAGFPRLKGLEQLVLVSDTWSCVLAGVGQLQEFLSVTAKLDENCEPAVWDVVHDGLVLLDRAVSEADRPVLRSWCSALMSPVLERLGWRAVAGESPRRSAARSILIRDLGVVAGDALVVERARASFERGLSERDTTDPGTWGAILAVVASAGGRAEFELFRAGYERPSSPQERRRNLDALIELREPELVSEVLSMCLAGMRGEDVASMLRRMLETPHAGTTAWRFLRDNWAALITAQPEKSIWRIMSGVSGLLRVEDDGQAPDAEDARCFIAAHPFGGLHQLVEQSLELLDVRLAFIRRERARIGQVLGAS
jgi:aminopeptidase N